MNDIPTNFDPNSVLTSEAQQHIEDVLEVYAKFSGGELEQMTHSEEPWIVARNNYPPSARCEKEIDEALMTEYYGARLA